MRGKISRYIRGGSPYGVFAALQALAEKKPVASLKNSNRLARCFVELISRCKGYSG